MTLEVSIAEQKTMQSQKRLDAGYERTRAARGTNAFQKEMSSGESDGLATPFPKTLNPHHDCRALFSWNPFRSSLLLSFLFTGILQVLYSVVSFFFF